MTTHTLTSRIDNTCVSHEEAQSVTGGLGTAVMGLLAAPDALLDRFATWQSRSAGRRKLLAMDDRMLSDIGVRRDEIVQEAQKPFWRA